MNSPVTIIPEQPGARMSSVRSGREVEPNGSFPPQPYDWGHAVHVATVLVSDKWVLPDTISHAAVTAMAEELAPFLCAYGAL